MAPQTWSQFPWTQAPCPFCARPIPGSMPVIVVQGSMPTPVDSGSRTTPANPGAGPTPVDPGSPPASVASGFRLIMIDQNIRLIPVPSWPLWLKLKAYLSSRSASLDSGTRFVPVDTNFIPVPTDPGHNHAPEDPVDRLTSVDPGTRPIHPVDRLTCWPRHQPAHKRTSDPTMDSTS